MKMYPFSGLVTFFGFKKFHGFGRKPRNYFFFKTIWQFSVFVMCYLFVLLICYHKFSSNCLYRLFNGFDRWFSEFSENGKKLFNQLRKSSILPLCYTLARKFYITGFWHCFCDLFTTHFHRYCDVPRICSCALAFLLKLCSCAVALL